MESNKMSPWLKAVLIVFGIIVFAAVAMYAVNRMTIINVSVQPQAAAPVEDQVASQMNKSLSGITYGQGNNPTGPSNMVSDPNTVPFAQSTTCGQFDLAFNGKDYVYGHSYPGTTMAGDIEVKVNGTWTSIHDNGSGEYTLLRNATDKAVEIRGIWGAGCLNGTDQMTMVLGEAKNPNHTDFVRVRDVEVQSDGTIVTKYFDKSGKEIPAP